MCQVIKMFALLLTISAVASAGIIKFPMKSDKPSVITSDKFLIQMQVDPSKNEKYRLEYETTVGSNRKEIGNFNLNSDGKKNVLVEGIYSFIGPDDKLHKKTYKMKENLNFGTTSTSTESTKISNRKQDEDDDDIIVFPDDFEDILGNNQLEETQTTTDATTAGIEIRVDLSPALAASLLG